MDGNKRRKHHAYDRARFCQLYVFCRGFTVAGYAVGHGVYVLCLELPHQILHEVFRAVQFVVQKANHSIFVGHFSNTDERFLYLIHERCYLILAKLIFHLTYNLKIMVRRARRLPTN
uniref:Uncharacterized protein n=1 Tax=Anopheles atroparvus TaxID=41427 RepID=A0AAG5DII1_ANOAO